MRAILSAGEEERGRTLPLLHKLRRDIEVCFERDPAATGFWEVLLTYPGFPARLFHRLAHTLYGWGAPLLPRPRKASRRE